MGERIQAFDLLRGVAVLVMIQTHCLGLLLPSLAGTPFSVQLVAIDGLVAPSFIFSAGFALALVQVRAARAGKREGQVKKSAKRITEVLLVALLINAIWFPFHREPKWFLRIDILHCIAVSLFALLPLLAALAARPKVLRWVTLAVALLVFGVSPLGEQVTGFWSLFLNTNFGWLDDTTGASFPLLPWAGYVFLGASFGATVGSMQKERELWAWLGLLIGLGGLMWWQSKFFTELYPPHRFWVTNPSNAAHRWTRVLILVAIFRLVERRWPKLATTRIFTWLAAFGGASLSAYFFHQMWLFQRHVGVFSKFFREKADWQTFWVLVGALIGVTWLSVKAWERIEPKLRARLSPTSSATPPRPAS